MDINAEIRKQTDLLIAEQLPTMIKAKATKMINEILDDIFKSYSDMGKKIKEKIEKQLDINLQEYDTLDYNAIVAKAINENITQQVNVQPILDLCKNAIGFIKKNSINMSEIIDMFKDQSMEENDQDAEGKISLFIERNDKHGWYEINIDAEAEVSKEDCGISFLVSEKDLKRIFSFHTRSYSSKKGKLTPSKITQLSILEHKIFRLYSAQVEVIMDETDFSIEWDRYN